MKPLFQVGEEVILQSKMYPESNGEYVVEKVLDYEEVYTSRNDGRLLMNGLEVGYAYLLDKIFPGKNGGEACWCETVLRKKHKPSDQSLEDMIKEINSKVKA